MAFNQNLIINIIFWGKIQIILTIEEKRAYGSQISQTVYYLFDYPLRMDRRRSAPWMQIIQILDADS